MIQSELYKFLMEYAYNRSAVVISECTCENGCNHPSGKCPSTRGVSCCWSKCLEEIYQHDTNPYGRLKYNCNKLVHQYLYRHLDRHASEIYIALKEVDDFVSEYQEFNVLSVGCGPCTELVGLDCYNKEMEYNKKINYIGLDMEPAWDTIHSKTDDLLKGPNLDIDYKCVIGDATNIECLAEIASDKINIIILNYIISSLYSNKEFQRLDALYSNIAELIVKKGLKNCSIIINDMNYRNIRGTETFINLLSKLEDKNIKINTKEKRHFSKWGKPVYGKPYTDNKTVFEHLFYPCAFSNNTCTSAQLLINCGV